MNVLLAVIDDLWQFARTALFGVLFIAPGTTTSTRAIQTQLMPQLQLPMLEESKLIYLDPGDVSYRHDSMLANKEVDFIQGARYFIGDVDTFLYKDPVVAFDTALENLSFGDIVHVVKFGGRWAHVQVRGREGWILKDSLREQVGDVFPEFHDGVMYDASNKETQKLRLYINDQFAGAKADVVLTDAEYVTYKLAKKELQIPWDGGHPRIAGTWQKKLRGMHGVHMGIVPKTDTVMEYVVDDVGHLAYVEAVFSDESIKISSIGMFDEGMFSDGMMQKAEWIELRPVFIEITV